ncbi:hypothetical protein ACFFX0_12080 [Citricoccus parietis]|uniref:Uncharacterized protein n=1 Tax=Citricoccus parietis TaxID=592307 RepID=A0ABV5FZR0_9MICC
MLRPRGPAWRCCGLCVLYPCESCGPVSSPGVSQSCMPANGTPQRRSWTGTVGMPFSR